MLQTVDNITGKHIKYNDSKILTYCSYFNGKRWLLAADRYVSWWDSCINGETCYSLALINGSLFEDDSYEGLVNKYKQKFGIELYCEGFGT